MVKATQDDPSAEDLLRIPVRPDRAKWETFLYAPYSAKNRRRVYASGPRGQALYLHLEADPQVARFNISVPPVPLIIGDRVKAVSPPAISMGIDRQIAIHDFSTVEEIPSDPTHSPPESPWVLWCTQRGWRLVEWTRASLWKNEILLANWETLLRYISSPSRIPSTVLEREILATISSSGETTWSKLAKCFPKEEPEVVDEAIAALVLGRRIESDIDSRSVSLLTRISAYPLAKSEPLRA